MRFLADEGFPGSAVTVLRRNGHDVVSVSENHPGASDKKLVGIAGKENRIILTLDKDFGDIAFQQKLPVSSGIVLFRGRITSLRQFSEFAVEVLESRDDWAGNLTVIERTKIRMRSLK